MPLDYKRNYKTRVKRRRIITISVIITVFLLASFSVLYFRFWSRDSQWNPIEALQIGQLKVDQPEELGMALERQPIHLYTIGIVRANLVKTNREYVRIDSRADDSYFDDALFIGDSRTEGFVLYSDLSNIQAYCSKGLSITRIYSDEIVSLEDGRKITVMEALQLQKYEKIYIMFGVNELGWPYDDLFQEQYSKLIQDVKLLQPEAVIYVENIIPISASRSEKDNIYNNNNVNRFNEMIKTVCEEQNVVYLDVASALADETGALPENASVDGIHCNVEYCGIWMEFLRNNTYEFQ